MKDMADAVVELLRQGDCEPCYKCTMHDFCFESRSWCADMIKAKLRGQQTWDPQFKEGS